MSKTTVLIVEDEAIVAADLAAKLRMLGYEVVGTAAEGEKAVELACRLEPQVVLMDIWLKGPMDGIAAAEAIRRRHCAPVIYLTAHSDSATLERAKLSEPFGYILKPFEERELSTAIEMALYKHQSDMQLRKANEELEQRVEERTRELVAASAYNRSLIEASLDPLVTIGRDGKITDVNAATEAATGRSRGELIGTDFSDYFSEPEKARAGYEQVFRDGSVRDFPLELRRLDGKLTSVLYNASVYSDEGGDVIGVFAAARDITEQKKAQEALRELNETLEEQVIERTAQLKSVNETLLASRKAALNLMEDAVIARRKAEEMSEELRLEITERTRSEEALRESELFYSQTLESIPGMVFTTRPDGYCDFQSRQWVEFTGVAMSEHLGDGWNRLLHPDDRPRAFEAWRAAVEGRAPYDLEYRVRRHDGEYEWFKVIGRPIRDAAGEIVKWFGVAVNIDANKKAEEELKVAREAAEAASRAKSLFLANMSHELRTPMTGVLGMLEIARSGPLDERQREAIDTAHMSGQSLLMIINDILDLTRIESGKLAIEEKPFPLRECLAGAVNILTPAAHGKELGLAHEVADDVPQTVIGDRMRLQQVLTNLIGNAVKFTERGKVEISVTAGGETTEGKREIIFSVSDTGIGIPDGKKETIFDSFCQADESHSRRFGGTGLGLAISREIVELMGGKIGCESREGEGSTFSFTIPLAVAGAEAVIIPEPAKTTLAGEAVQPEIHAVRKRILIAEDDEVTRKVLGYMLQKSEFDFEFAVNGLQVLEMWENGGYDLIVMDGQMPGLDGFEATRTIRSRGGKIPIVAMTAHALKEDEDRCLAAGMDAYVSKPIDFRRCLEVIRGVIGHGGREEK